MLYVVESVKLDLSSTDTQITLMAGAIVVVMVNCVLMCITSMCCYPP